MSTFGARLKLLRKQDDLTQDALAKALGISKSTISMYENGNREPDFETLEAFADYFNVDLDYLMGKSDIANKTIESSPLYEELLRQVVADRADGREGARESMFQSHGVDHGTHITRLIDDKHVLLYYHAFDDSRSTSAGMYLLELLEKLVPAEAEHLELLVSAYYAADERSRQMVDLALDPFLSKEEKEWTGPLARDDASAEQELAHHILHDKRSGGGLSASNGDAGKKKEA